MSILSDFMQRRWNASIIFIIFIVSCALVQPLEESVSIHVVVSHFSPHSKSVPHFDEIEASIAANLLNPSITSLHILYESSSSDEKCNNLLVRLTELIRLHWPDRSLTTDQVKSRFGCTDISTGRATLHEFLIQYPHSIFGARSSGAKEEQMKKTVVVAINGDIVLDESIQRLSSLKEGHVAALTVNTGPDMINCCFDTFQSIISTEGSNMAAQARAKAGKSDVFPQDLKLSCGASNNNQSTCKNTLPDTDQSTHVKNLREFYHASRISRDLPTTCTNHQWSTGGFQFCGSPKVNKVVSWDGYGYVLPLPESLQNKNNPWYFGIPQSVATTDLDLVGSPLKGAYAPYGLMYMNRNGVEARTACSLQAAGLVLHNPCRHIRIAHWHCDPKTHFGKNRSDRGDVMKKINDFVGEEAPTYGQAVSSLETCSVFDISTTCRQGVDDCGGIDMG